VEEIRVLLVFRSDIYREGLITLMKNEPAIIVLGSCSSSLDAEEKVRNLKPDVALLDTDLHEGDCVMSTRRISELSPKTKAIIFTHSTESRDLFNAIKTGAVGYVTKYIPSADLIKSITLIANGEAIIDAPLAAKLSANTQ